MESRRLPHDILERVDRVMEFHRSTKLTPESVRANPVVLDPTTKPSAYLCFEDQKVVMLPTNLLDAPAPMLSVLTEGLGAVYEGHRHPPQDLKTLASWLFLANGLTPSQGKPAASQGLRTCPSSGALYPYEIYVAAFAIEGLEPGLYHYNVRDLCLCKLREGPATLAMIKRGRPDLNFLKSVPAVLLVSSVFWRSAWRYRQRGYRMALLDCGHVVQNLVTSANSLGVQTMPRLQVNEKTMRELIGISPGTDFGALESVQAMVVWADSAKTPMSETGVIAPKNGLPRLHRMPLSQQYVPYGSIIATQEDCVAPGIALREVRPPLTELSPYLLEPDDAAVPYGNPPPTGPSARQALLARRSTRDFAERPISRDQFLAINRLAFRGGSMFPMMPDGPHIALLRPFWICHLISGMDAGVWYYDPISDRLICASRGNFHNQSAFLCVEQKLCGQAAAVCFLAADLRALTTGAGPDAYRLAHLEAGVAGQRIYLAATSLGLGCCGIGAFYDDPVRTFLGLDETNWEPIYALAIGMLPQQADASNTMKPEPANDRETPGREFLTTHWSMVLVAGSDGSSRAAEAMQQLCSAYWYPLYAFVRQRGSTPHDAQDLTQEFFAQLLKRGDIATVRREKGKFRSFLLASLQHFLANEWKKASRLKRGGGKIVVSINAASAESRYASEPSHDLAPDKLFERRWAMALLDQALEYLRQEFVKSDKLPLFEQLKVFLAGDENAPSYADIGAKVGLSESAVKMAVSRLRRRYREVLRAQIERTRRQRR